jgi:hypothetical protein
VSSEEPQLGQQQPSRTPRLNPHTCGAETLAVQGIPDLKPRSSSQASFAYDPPDEMPADGELTATPGGRPELLIWADNAHTRWQLTASRIDGYERTCPGNRAHDAMVNNFSPKSTGDGAHSHQSVRA